MFRPLPMKHIRLLVLTEALPLASLILAETVITSYSIHYTKLYEQDELERYLEQHHQADDGAHDIAHFRRVWRTARALNAAEGHQADERVLLAAAYLHDIISLPKNHPERHLSSRLAAREAERILAELGFPASLRITSYNVCYTKLLRMLPEQQVQLGETHMFLAPRFFMTVRHGPSVTYSKVRERLETMPARLARGPAMSYNFV